MITRSKNGIIKPKGSLALSIVSSDFSLSETKPKHFSEAIKHIAWQQAMADEYEAKEKQGTWTLVSPPSHANVTCQWIYKIKRHSDGSVARYKARLVARGIRLHRDI